jgi:hypothetical protein
LILRDLELRAAQWLVSAYSKGLNEFGSEEATEACVYPRSMIHETEIKSREKFAGLFLTPKFNGLL